MIDPTWTPDAAHDLLRDALARFLTDDVSPVSLYAWLMETYATPPGTAPSHPANRLWQQAILNVAVYLQCDFERATLAESVQMILDADRDRSASPLTPITRSPCFFQLVKSGTAPYPLTALATEDAVRRERLRREGFEGR